MDVQVRFLEEPGPSFVTGTVWPPDDSNLRAVGVPVCETPFASRNDRFARIPVTLAGGHDNIEVGRWVVGPF